MAIESQDELEQKIIRQEHYLAELEAKDEQGKTYDQDIANTKLEIARLKNLKGDEGINPASEIDFPETTIDQTTAVNTPDHKNVRRQVLSGTSDITQDVEGNTDFKPTGPDRSNPVAQEDPGSD